ATVATGTNTPEANPRKWMVEDRLMAPDARKIRRVVFTDFGVLLDALPPSATFTGRNKNWSRGGAGRGSPIPGPTSWRDLRPFVDTLAYIRNATAHGDATKLSNSPSGCEGLLWLTQEDGNWSVQQPHALTALRTVVCVFNTVAEALATATSYAQPLALTT